MMKIYSSLISFVEDSGGMIYKMDTIEYEGVFWLVPTWLEDPAEGRKRPERIVSLAAIPHQGMRGNALGDFLINGPVPRHALFDPAPLKEAWRSYVRFAPNIPVPFGTA